MAADLARLRERLADQVVAANRIGSERVAAALHDVPRHLFLPGQRPEAAYRDDAIVTKRDEAGQPISSSSQPAIMAIMLDQLDLAPGQRVLEIGAGTGYNAALISHMVGPSGQVTSVDIDPELVATAREHLARAEFGDVTVACALTGLLVSPLTWDHHWVWVAPGIALLADLGVRARGAVRAGWWAAGAAVVLVFGAWPQFWDLSQAGLTPAGLFWYGPATYFATGSQPWYHEFHWHGLQLLAGNSFVLAGLAALAALCVAAIRMRSTGHRRA